MKNLNFVITSLQPWDIEIGSTIKNTALEISKNNKVVYINTPMDFTAMLKGKSNRVNQKRIEVIKKKRPSLRLIKENLWVADCPFVAYPINISPTKSLFDFFNKRNNKNIAKHIIKTVNELGFQEFIHIIDTDIYRSQYLKELIAPSLSIYYKRDHIVDGKYFKKYGKESEDSLIKKSDLIIANSLYFANQIRNLNSNVYDLETGVNLELYNYDKKWNVPEELSQIKRPIIGYVGTLKVSRLDLELIYYISQQRPDYSFVLIGPEDDAFQSHPIHALKNVFFLGVKPVQELPAYIYGLDVAINPQKLNPITIGNYPLKIDEYLAMGKPVVATKTDTMQHIFSQYTFLASSKEEYAELIDCAMKESNNINKEKERVAFANTHSWENSVNKLYKFIEFQDLK